MSATVAPFDKVHSVTSPFWTVLTMRPFAGGCSINDSPAPAST